MELLESTAKSIITCNIVSGDSSVIVQFEFLPIILYYMLENCSSQITAIWQKIVF